MYNRYMGKKQTPYGLDAYRKPYFKGEFRYPQGSKQEAVIIDIDGCVIDWGDAANMKLRAWAQKHYDAGRALIVMTARDQGMFTSSFNTLLRVFPFPFIGPFCRRVDDPRYAPEFKRETTEWLSQQYDIVGAADDSKYVNTMWEWWAEEYFEDPADFDHFKTEYTAYPKWRKDLPPKPYPKSKFSAVTPVTNYSSHWGSTMVGGAKHREAGASRFFSDEGKEEYVPWYDQVYNDNKTDLDTIDAQIEAAYAEKGGQFAEEVGS